MDELLTVVLVAVDQTVVAVVVSLVPEVALAAEAAVEDILPSMIIFTMLT